MSFIRHHHDYLGISILATLAPTVKQLEPAVSWIKIRLDPEERVFVHGALGYG